MTNQNYMSTGDEDPEKRIAELERQLAEAKLAAQQDQDVRQSSSFSAPPIAHGPVDDQALRFAQALQESMKAGQLGGPDAARVQEALAQAAVESAMSYKDALERAGIHPGVTINVNGETVYQGQEFPQTFTGDIGSGPPPTFFVPSNSETRPAARSLRSRLKLSGPADVFGAVAAAVAAPFGIGIAGSAALTAVFPSSAQWMSPIICGAPNRLMVNTSHYSYTPNQSGTSIDFQCVGVDGAHDANFFAVAALQGLAGVVVLAGAIAMGLLLRRRLRGQPAHRAYAVIASGLSVLALGMIAFIAWPVITGSAATQMPPGGSLTVEGNGETKTIACSGGHLTVDGRDETVTVTGHCGRISVDGVINHVTVDSVDEVDTEGINNVVTYHSGSPRIATGGSHNIVQHG